MLHGIKDGSSLRVQIDLVFVAGEAFLERVAFVLVNAERYQLTLEYYAGCYPLVSHRFHCLS
jgi:hypothetical protein